MVIIQVNSDKYEVFYDLTILLKHFKIPNFGHFRMQGYGSLSQNGENKPWFVFFKHGHVAYQIHGDDEQNRVQVKFHSRVKL